MDALLDDRRSQIMGIHKNILELARDGHYNAAMEKAFFALQNAPTFLPLHVTIGDLLMEQNKNSGAVAKYLAVADVYMIQGKTERALAQAKGHAPWHRSRDRRSAPHGPCRHGR